MQKVNIVFGVTGQVGSYLAEYLLEKGEKVIGVARRVSTNNLWRLENILGHKDFQIVTGDVTDVGSLFRVFNNNVTDKNVEYVVYNLAAMSFVKASFDQAILSNQVTALGHINILEVLFPLTKLNFKIKLFFMSSSETWGSNVNSGGFQNFNVPFSPNSPYGSAKLHAYDMNRIYRQSYGMFNTSGVIFNSESPRRGEEFVTRKITQYFARLMVDNLVVKEKLKLGNVNTCRDWTHAKDTVKAIYLIANNILPKDYIVASGETHTIKDFIKECYFVSQEIIGDKCYTSIEDLYEIDEEFFRPNEVKYLRGDSSAIRYDLGWKPQYNFSSLVKDMVNCDYQRLLNKQVGRESVYAIKNQN